MFEILFKSFWFILPAMISNSMPVWAAQVSWLDSFAKPMDSGKKLNGKPLFGKNKTYRGLFVGIFAGALVGALQYFAVTTLPFLENFEFMQFTLSTYVALGTLQGFGALVGDAIESGFKRQINVAPGDSWFPFDQVDYIIGATLCSLVIFVPSIPEFLGILSIGIILHIITVFLGYKLGIREKPI